MSLFIGAVYFDQQLTQEGIQNINGAIFLMIANLSFSSIVPVANVKSNPYTCMQLART